MGDFHFLVRHALTGAVFLFFLFLGFILFYGDGQETLKFISYLQGKGELKDISSLFTLVVTAPVIGITIQGILIAYLHVFNTPFNDDARKEVARHFKNNLKKDCNTLGIPPNKLNYFVKTFKKMSPDSLFVWLYHSDAPPHLIEWARRRRSYNYLGLNWAIAAFIGLLTGLLIGRMEPNHTMFDNQNWFLVKILLLILSCIWIGGAIWLAKKMKQDVDTMEYVWTCVCLYPSIKSELNKKEELVSN